MTCISEREKKGFCIFSPSLYGLCFDVRYRPRYRQREMVKWLEASLGIGNITKRAACQKSRTTMMPRLSDAYLEEHFTA